MHFNTRMIATAIVLSFCGAGSAMAAKAPVADELASLIRGVETDVARVDTVQGQFTPDGAALALYNPTFRAQPGTAAEMAQAYLAADFARLGLRTTDVADFAVAHVREGSDFSVVRLRQSVQGIPVFGSDLAVSVTPAGKIIFVTSAVVRGLGTPDLAKANATSAQALAIASSYLGTALKDEESEQMVYRDADGVTRVVWRVIGSPVTRNGEWQLLIDAETGEVLRAQDIALYANGTGTVFQPDPLSSARQLYNNATGYGDSPAPGGIANGDSPQLTAQLFPVTLLDITLTGSNYTLVGPWADCREMDPPADGACPTQTSSDFSVTRSNLYFDAVNVYHHIDTYMRYVNTTLGVPVQPTNYPAGVRFDPHGVNGDDNSNYAPGAQRLSFGQGDVDDAQDADVVIHELGHGLHDWITGGNLSTAQGLSEGFGDFVAAGYSRDFPNQWTPADDQYYWTFSWDGHNSGGGFGWAGRRTDWQLGHTYATMGTSYNAGMYWASCNLVARDLMGSQAMDKAYYKGMSMTTNTTNQKVAAQAISSAATAMNYTNAQMTALDYAYNAGNTGGNKGCTYAVTVTIPPAVDLIFRQGFDSTP
ncbi:MAG: hypothetical protein WBP11_15070 [Dokdonella sp.]